MRKLIQITIGILLLQQYILLTPIECSKTYSTLSYLNYLTLQEQLFLIVKIKNQTSVVFEKGYNFTYTLNQQQISDEITLPVSLNMKNYTIVTELFKKNKIDPIQSSTRKLTRFSKIHKNSQISSSAKIGQIHNKITQQSNFGLHLPHKFIIMPLFMQQVISKQMMQLINIFKFKTIRQQKVRYYIPPIDLSQLHVPYKAYQPVFAYILRKSAQRAQQAQQYKYQKQQQNQYQNHQSLPAVLSPLQQEYYYNMSLIIRVYPFNYYYMFYGFTDVELLRKHAPMQFMQTIYTDGIIDMFKQLLFQNNPYFLGLYVILSLVQFFMQIFAFKNEIQIWKSVQKKGGLSIKSLYQWLVCYVIMLLYLIDQEANSLYVFFIILDIIITLWKITKAIQVSVTRQFPYVKFGYKQWYHNKTESADRQATHYTSYLIAILFSIFMLYKMYPIFSDFIQIIWFKEGSQGLSSLNPKWRKIYSFLLQSFMGFIFVFGFVMITPQLYINYKLKSVDHLPWKTLVYRFISTIIDDIFVFMISLPWLQRAFSFRDDIVFVIYIIQRRMYSVDQKRLALGRGGSLDLSKIKQMAQLQSESKQKIS